MWLLMLAGAPAYPQPLGQSSQPFFRAAARTGPFSPSGPCPPSSGRSIRMAKGMGIAAPQIGIGRAAALVQLPEPDTPAIVLLNPRITDSSRDEDEQYEGCLSFFDVRGRVPRPLRITVETTTLDGEVATTTYHRGLARLIHHEVDHLDGLLYTARMRTGIDPIPVEEYRQTGHSWAYKQ
ncbi:peptide deformylase [Streptomyces sp. MBT57]|nr:peptide deformylase [Streptomyces sp. MBT57]